METCYKRIRCNIIDRLCELRDTCKEEDKGSYQLIYEEGPIYFEADLNVVFSNVNVAGAILEATDYVWENTRYKHATRRWYSRRIDLLRDSIFFIIKHCPGLDDVKDQTDEIIDSLVNNTVLYLKKVETPKVTSDTENIK